MLDAATSLVAERGFHAVGILDIGAAAGVSGSALYRHFANKQELLVAVLDRVIDQLLAGAREVEAMYEDPRLGLGELVDRHIDFALRNRAVIAVYDQESHYLPSEHRDRLRANQRSYADVWIAMLRELRPDLNRNQASISVHGIFGLVNSVADHDPRIPVRDAAELLRTMALSSLGLIDNAIAGKV